MKVKTSELIGPALDWAVAVALGALWQEASVRPPFFIWPGDPPHYSMRAPTYSTDWAQGGPIIERESIAIHGNPAWTAKLSVPVNCPGGYFFMVGHTPLIAAMRCFVALKLGNEVDVPEELL